MKLRFFFLARGIFLLGLSLAIGLPAHTETTPSAPAQRTKRIVMLVAEPQWQTQRTLPVFAEKFLKSDFRVVFVTGSTADGEVAFDNIEEIAKADLLLVSVRRRTPPEAQMAIIRDYVRAGKPVVGIRTASHAFKLIKGQPAAGS